LARPEGRIAKRLGLCRQSPEVEPGRHTADERDPAPLGDFSARMFSPVSFGFWLG
jgi:hypothetical protein